MRIKIALGLIVVFFGVLFALLHLQSAPAASLVFVRYIDRTDFVRGHFAMFDLLNHTGTWIEHGASEARIEIKTAGGWTVYSDPAESIVRSGLYGAEPQGHESITRLVPQDQTRWRLHVSYSLRGPQWTRLKFLSGIVSAMNAGDRKLEVFSQEMPNEAVR